jgi:hypothetical protein
MMVNDRTELMVRGCQYTGCNSPLTVEGKSYCEDHVWLVYQKGSALSRRPKDQLRASNIQLWESLFNEAVEQLIEEGEL